MVYRIYITRKYKGVFVFVFLFCFFFHFLSVVVNKVQVNLQHDLKKKLGTNARNDEEVI
jgi:lipopolysaccharide export LptBFGC system permease protein LptF